MKKFIQKYGFALIIAAVVIVSAANLVYDYGYSDESFEQKSYDTQAMYSEDYFEKGQYPDLFLRVLVRDKHVVLAHAPKSYADYPSAGHDDEDENPFSQDYFRENNFTYWFTAFAGSYSYDETLLTGDAVSENMVPHQEDFTDYGVANDMLRYSFPMNHEHYQEATRFWYSWYYNTYAAKALTRKIKRKRYDPYPDVYVNMDGIMEADTLVALIAKNEDLYLMSEETYQEYMK